MKSNRTYAYLLVCCLGVSALSACHSKDTNTGQNMATLPISAAPVNVAADSAQAQFDRARTQIDELLTERNQMDSLLALKNNELSRVTNRLKKEQKNNRQYAVKLKKEKDLVSKLNIDTRVFADRISKLQAQNDMLLAREDSLMHQYLALRELGSVLHASNMRLTAMHLKHHGAREKKTVKARKTNVLRVDFDIDENRIAENGTKKLYLLITGPDGQLLSDNVAVAGNIHTNDGGVVKYSVEKDIPLRKGEPVKDVIVDWKQENNYKKGKYNITIYNGGYKIGGGTVALI